MQKLFDRGQTSDFSDEKLRETTGLESRPYRLRNFLKIKF